MRNIAVQLGLQQCCKTSCTFLVALFTEALVLFCIVSLVFKRFHPELCRFWTTFSVSSFVLSRYGDFLLLNIKH